jgi:glycine cleavage system H protein
MSNVKFTEDHEWIRIEGDTGTIGITDYAQEQLGDVVYVELPEVGRKVEKGKDMAVVESVKAASEVYAPVSGSVTAINDKLTAEPATVNAAAMGDGWFVKIKLSNPSELDKLMDEAAYKKFVEGLG